jgi:hypothetical protein
MLVDEVDVFFSNKFFGNAYIPAFSIKSSCVSRLADYVWFNKDDISYLKIV